MTMNKDEGARPGGDRAWESERDGRNTVPENLESSPFYMPEQFSSGHIQRKVLEPLLRSCDHSFVGFLYARDRLEHHHLNPWLHLQRGLKRNGKIVNRCFEENDFEFGFGVGLRGHGTSHLRNASYHKDAIAILLCPERDVKIRIGMMIVHAYRMCWDSGWTYDKQNISPRDIQLQIAKRRLVFSRQGLNITQPLRKSEWYKTQKIFTLRPNSTGSKSCVTFVTARGVGRFRRS